MKKNTEAAPTPITQPESTPVPVATVPADHIVQKLYVLSAGIAQGGVGKTTIMSELAAWYADRGVAIIKLDLDETGKSKGSFASFCPDATRAALSNDTGMNAMLDALDLQARVALADAAASTSQVTAKWFDDLYPELSALGHRFLALGVITQDAASVEGFLRWASLLQNRVNYVVVQNDTVGSGSFSIWDHSPAAAKFMENSRARLIRTPYRERDIQELLRKHSLTAAAVASRAHGVDELKLGKWAVRAQSIRRRTTEQFDQIADLLLPAGLGLS